MTDTLFNPKTCAFTEFDAETRFQLGYSLGRLESLQRNAPTADTD